MSQFSNPVFPKIVAPTITTGITEIDVGGSGYRWNAPCNGTILGVKVMAQRAGVPTTGESDTVVVRLKSNTGSMKTIAPYEILAQPVEQGLSTTISPVRFASPMYPVNCPCAQGDQLQITAAELTACTVHIYVGVTIIFAANQVTVPQYHSQISSITASSTAAGDSTKSSVTIVQSNGFTIKEIYGLIVDGTLASGKGISGYFHGYSSQNKAYGDIQFVTEGVPAILTGGVGEGATQLTILKDLNIPFQSPANIDWYFNLAVTITTAANWSVMTVYY
jgi:hypothetical protein